MRRAVVWFSCGKASAVAAKLAIDKYGERCEVVYCNTLASEHPDNPRFMADVSQWIGKPITIIGSEKYASVDDVIEKTRYMAGIHGARCTTELKKLPREAFQREGDVHIFGFTLDEQKRIEQFERNNPNLECEWILADSFIRKADCGRILEAAGIALPAMYDLHYENNNCPGCLKATSSIYWNKIRKDFPEVFKKRCKQSRMLGVKLVRHKGERIYLDELPIDASDGSLGEDIECGVGCQMFQPSLLEVSR